MDGATVALLAGGAAAAGAAGYGLAALRFASRRTAIVEKGAAAAQRVNRRHSDERIEAIYRTIHDRAMAANVLALAEPTVDVSSAYIDLTAAIKHELDGLYDLSDGVFQMVLAVRNSMHEAPKVTAPRYTTPAGGETVTWFPNSPENQPAETARPSVNEKMKTFIKAFHAFWSQAERRKAEMERARAALGLPLDSDDDFLEAVVREAERR